MGRNLNQEKISIFGNNSTKYQGSHLQGHTILLVKIMSARPKLYNKPSWMVLFQTVQTKDKYLHAEFNAGDIFEEIICKNY